MAFCKNCGTKLGEDERFCGNCGTPAEGPTVNSQVPNTTYAANNTQPAINVNFDGFTVHMTEILNLSVNTIKKPISTILSASNTLKKQTVLWLFAVLSIVFGLLNIWNIKAIATKAASASGDLSDIGLQELFVEVIEGISSKINYGKIFLYSIILFIASITIIFLVFHLVKKYIVKKPSYPLNIFTVALCSSIPFIFGFLAKIILSYISATIGFVAIFIALIVSVLSLFKGMSSELELSEDKTAFLIPISYLVMFLIYYIVLRIFMKR